MTERRTEALLQLGGGSILFPLGFCWWPLKPCLPSSCPASLPQSFSGAALLCNGNRRRAGANNWDISGQPGPIVVSSCLCRPLALLLFVFLPPRRPVSCPQCVFLACSGLSGWPGNVQLILGLSIYPGESGGPILETQLFRSQPLECLALNLGDIFQAHPQSLPQGRPPGREQWEEHVFISGAHGLAQ